MDIVWSTFLRNSTLTSNTPNSPPGSFQLMHLPVLEPGDFQVYVEFLSLTSCWARKQMHGAIDIMAGEHLMQPNQQWTNCGCSVQAWCSDSLSGNTHWCHHWGDIEVLSWESLLYHPAVFGLFPKISQKLLSSPQKEAQRLAYFSG